MVIELLYYSVAPRLSRWDEPGIDSVEQAEPDKRPHSLRMDRTAEESHFIVHHRRYCTREEAIMHIDEYIEIFYNRQRRQAGLNYLSPAAFEKQFYAWQKAA